MSSAPERPRRRTKQGWARAIPLAPALLFVVAVTQIPFAITLYYSFHRLNLVTSPRARYDGVANFASIIRNGVFQLAILNTAIITISVVVISIFVGGLLATGLRRDFPGCSIARTLAITPFFVMPVAAALFWKTGLYDPTFGILGWITSTVHLGRIDWISSFPRLSVILVSAWQWSAFALLILLAGMQSFPEDVAEAAAIDGAGRLYVFRRLMLPHLRPFIELTGLLTSMYVIQTFAAIAVLTAGGPAYATTNLSYEVYLEAFSSFNIGRASAFGIVALVISIALVLPVLKIVSGLFREGGRA